MQPLFLMTIWCHLGMESLSIRKYSRFISWHQSFVITCFRTSRLVVFLSDIRCFMWCQQLYIGLRSGLFPGHPNASIFLVCSHFVTFFALCMKYEHWWSSNIVTMWSLRTLIYRSPFTITLLERKHSPTLPLSPEKAPPHHHWLWVLDSWNCVSMVITVDRRWTLHFGWTHPEHLQRALIGEHYFPLLRRCPMCMFLGECKSLILHPIVYEGFLGSCTWWQPQILRQPVLYSSDTDIAEQVRMQTIQLGCWQSGVLLQFPL